MSPCRDRGTGAGASRPRSAPANPGRGPAEGAALRAPAPPFGSRPSSRAPDESLRDTGAQRARTSSLKGVVPQAAEDDRDEKRDPDRERDREHGDSNVEEERVHCSSVVAPESSDVPRTRDPSRTRARASQLQTGMGGSRVERALGSRDDAAATADAFRNSRAASALADARACGKASDADERT